MGFFRFANPPLKVFAKSKTNNKHIIEKSVLHINVLKDRGAITTKL
jgi:hypothetical protein